MAAQNSALSDDAPRALISLYQPILPYRVGADGLDAGANANACHIVADANTTGQLPRGPRPHH